MKALAFVLRQKPRGPGTLSGKGGWLHGEQSPSPQTRGHSRTVSERRDEVKKGPVAAGRLALSYEGSCHYVPDRHWAIGGRFFKES